MTGSHISRISMHGYKRLGLQGQPVVVAYAQLTTVLRSRLGREHADFLAVPQIDPKTGDIDWYASRTGTVRKVSDLPEADQAPLRSLADQLKKEIAQLADKLKREGDASELLGRMFEQAIASPPGDWLYEVGGKPVQVMWGHASEGAVASDVAPVVPPVLPVRGAAAAAGTLAAQGAVDVRGRRGWWRWLLPFALLLLLLALLLAFRGCESYWLADEVARAEERDKALKDELALLERQRDAGALHCVPVTPLEQPPADVGKVPEEKPDTKPFDVAKGPEEKPPEIPPEKPVEKKPEKRKPEVDKSIAVPEEAARQGKVDFLDGWWKSRDPVGEVDQTGKKVDVDDIYFNFDSKGEGEVVLRRRSDGSLCRGPARGHMEGNKLKIDVLRVLNCERPPPFRASNVECERMPEGNTRCNGIGYGGRPFSVDIIRSTPVAGK